MGAQLSSPQCGFAARLMASFVPLVLLVALLAAISPALAAKNANATVLPPGSYQLDSRSGAVYLEQPIPIGSSAEVNVYLYSANITVSASNDFVANFAFSRYYTPASVSDYGGRLLRWITGSSLPTLPPLDFVNINGSFMCSTGGNIMVTAPSCSYLNSPSAGYDPYCGSGWVRATMASGPYFFGVGNVNAGKVSFGITNWISMVDQVLFLCASGCSATASTDCV